jgi:hypothetical protein
MKILSWVLRQNVGGNLIILYVTISFSLLIFKNLFIGLKLVDNGNHYQLI